MLSEWASMLDSQAGQSGLDQGGDVGGDVVEYTSLPIRAILEQVKNGQIRIPAFQRTFVWDIERVAYLMDSLYKQYPFGSLLFWRTKEQLQADRNMGPFILPRVDPQYPIDYVLDGQQRITSIFAVFQTDHLPRRGDARLPEWMPIYFDYVADVDVQDSQFLAIPEDKVDVRRHFPIGTLFDVVGYRQAMADIPQVYHERIDYMQSVFKEARIPVQKLTTEDRTKVAIVFSRVNRQGLALDTLQLLTAWTWNEDFHLKQRFADLQSRLERYGFGAVGEDTTLVLRCCAAVLLNKPSAESLVEMHGAEVRRRFPDVESGIEGAVEFLRTQLHVEALDNLPYPALLVPLAVFFANPDGRQLRYDHHTYERLLRWFWRSCFSRRYSGQTSRALTHDIEEMRKLKAGEPSQLGEFNYELDENFFLTNQFNVRAANTKTFVLMLAQAKPKSLLTGADISLGKVMQNYNRAEFHHLFPGAFLRRRKIDDRRIDCLANFCFLSRADNNRISNRAPSQYRDLMPADPQKLRQILSHAYIPFSLFADSYTPFLKERSRILTDAARRLMD
jgi:hypothetical protein